jgi:WD40 repeat protein
MRICPPSEMLGQLLAGELSGPEAESIREHLSDCSACQAALDQLSDDSELRQWIPAATLELGEVSEGPALGRLLGKIWGATHAGQATVVAERPTGRPIPSLGPPLREGDLGSLGPYRVEAELGRGGMGIVLRGYDEGLQRTVALKLLRPELADEIARARLVREARTAARLRHDHVVGIYAVVDPPDGLPYVVMEYLAGPTLDQLIRQGQLRPKEVAELIAQAADGLAAAHEAGLVHRDIKPSNLMIDPATDRAKVTDFGLARAAERPSGLTCEGALAGTPAYMSPEQARGDAVLDAKTDVYSLGVTLYEALTGQVPFQGTLTMVLQQVLQDEPKPPQRLNNAIPCDLETICLKAMAKEPSRRYHSARELGEDLRRFLRGEPIRARPAGPIERLGRWCRRNPILATATGLAATGLVAATLVSIAFAAYQTRAADRLRQEQRRTQEALDSSQQLSFRLALDRGLALCEQKDTGLGMLWLTRALEVAPEGRTDLHRVLRVNLANWRHHVSVLQAILPHPGQVVAVAFQPSGSVVATACDDGRVRLWSFSDGEPRAIAMAHQGPVTALAFAPDGRSLLSASADGTARLWDTATGQPKSGPLAHEGPVAAVAFRPDGQVFSTASRDGTARLWKAETTAPIGQPLRHSSPLAGACFSPDGQTLLTWDADRSARLWNAATHEPIGPPLEHEQMIKCAVFSPDGTMVLTGGLDYTTRLWDATTGAALGAPLPDAGEVWGLAFAPDGKIFATASDAHYVQLWNARTRRPIGERLKHPDAVTAVVFSPDGRFIATGCNDASARVWDVATGQPVGQPLPQGEGWITSVAFGPDGQALLAGGGRSARLWRVARGQRERLKTGFEVPALAVRFRLDGRAFLVGGGWTARGDRAAQGLAQLFDASHGQPLGPPLQHEGPVASVGFDREGRRILTGGYDGTARLWDAATGQPLGEPIRPRLPVIMGAVFRPDGRAVLIGAHDESFLQGEAQFFDASHGQPLGPPMPTSKGLMSVALSPNGQTVLTGDTDGTIRRWEAASGRMWGAPIVCSSPVMALAFRPDGRVILAGCHNGKVLLYDLDTGQPFGPVMKHQDVVESVAFSPDGTTLLTGSSDNTARLWDAATGQPLGAPWRFRRGVFGVAFRADGRAILTAAHADKTIWLWDVPEPVEGPTDRLRLWVQMLTGLELGASGLVHVLDASSWRERQRQLEPSGRSD